jgi:hypothetical protein
MDKLVTLGFWTGKIADRKLENPPVGTNPARSIQGMMILLGGDLDLLAAGVEDAGKNLPDSNPLKSTYAEVVHELQRAESLWRSATQPRISKAPGFILDSSCSDHPKGDTLSTKEEQLEVGHGDRKPSPSLILTIRQLHANDDPLFAKGQKITLTAVEPKLSWPLSGRFDFLEGQVGAGRYWMKSDGFPNGVTQQGWILEPIRFDLHVPSKFADGPWWQRSLTILSYSAGVVVFPGGFAADAFREGSTPIAGGEAVFEQNFVLNLGRLLR